MAIRDDYNALRRHRWLIAVMVVIIMGYSLGKDRALRENARPQSVAVQ